MNQIQAKVKFYVLYCLFDYWQALIVDNLSADLNLIADKLSTDLILIADNYLRLDFTSKNH